MASRPPPSWSSGGPDRRPDLTGWRRTERAGARSYRQARWIRGRYAPDARPTRAPAPSDPASPRPGPAGGRDPRWARCPGRSQRPTRPRWPIRFRRARGRTTRRRSMPTRPGDRRCLTRSTGFRGPMCRRVSCPRRGPGPTAATGSAACDRRTCARSSPRRGAPASRSACRPPTAATRPRRPCTTPTCGSLGPVAGALRAARPGHSEHQLGHGARHPQHHGRVCVAGAVRLALRVHRLVPAGGPRSSRATAPSRGTSAYYGRARAAADPCLGPRGPRLAVAPRGARRLLIPRLSRRPSALVAGASASPASFASGVRARNGMTIRTAPRPAIRSVGAARGPAIAIDRRMVVPPRAARAVPAPGGPHRRSPGRGPPVGTTG